jgi:hypothetical protein
MRSPPVDRLLKAICTAQFRDLVDRIDDWLVRLLLVTLRSRLRDLRRNAGGSRWS